MKKLFCILLPLIAFSSCTEKPEKPPLLKLQTNSPVNFGEHLRVFVDVEDGDNYPYIIKHPNGLEHRISYDNSNAKGSDNGWYVGSVYDHEGRLRIDSIKVEVIPEPVPCSNWVNSLTSSYANLFMNFTYLNGHLGSNGLFQVDGYSAQGEIYLDFSHEERPVENRTYITKSQLNDMDSEDYVSIWVKWQGITMYPIPGQHVHVEADSSTIVINMCEINFVNLPGGGIINAKLVVQ